MKITSTYIIAGLIYPHVIKVEEGEIYFHIDLQLGVFPCSYLGQWIDK